MDMGECAHASRAEGGHGREEDGILTHYAGIGLS